MSRGQVRGQYGRSAVRTALLAAYLIIGLLLLIPAALSAPQVTGSGSSAITVCDPSPLTYTLTITNPSGSAASGLVASVTLPAGFSYGGTTSLTYPSSASPRVVSSQNPTGISVLVWDISSILKGGKSALINEVHPNPTSPASQQVEIFNSGISPVDLSGWTLKRSNGAVVAMIPENITSGSLPLAPGSFLLLRASGLNSNADDVLLCDATGAEKDRVSYSSGSSNQGKSYASQPDGARGTASLAWRTATLGLTNGGTRGDLNVGETVVLSFTMKAGCSAQDGQNLRADLAYNGGTASFTTPSTFAVGRGLLKVIKTPSVVTAGVDDEIEFEIAVENIGTGTAYNVELQNILGSGLSQISATPAPSTSLPPNYTWNLGSITVGERKTVKVLEKVMNCTDLYEEARANWGCSGDLCQNNYAKAAVKILLKMPGLDFSLPTSVSVPYCGKAWVRIPYANNGLGKAKSLHFHILGKEDGYQIDNVTGGSYNEAASLLTIGDVPAQSSGAVSFDISLKQSACDAPPSGVLAFEPNYFDECDKEWAPPTKLFPFSLDPNSRPSIALSKSGPDSLYLGQTGEYSIAATYHRGSSGDGEVKVDIVDSYPAGFAVIQGAGGAVNASAHTITWKDALLRDGVTWSPDGGLVLRASDNPCDCGRAFANRVNTSISSDCRGCPLSGGTAMNILVECAEGFSSSKSASPAAQENCRDIGYTTTYRFNSTAGLSWTDMSYTEQGNNNQTFPDGSKTGIAQFTILDQSGSVLGTFARTITLGQPISLDFLSPTLADGMQLQIVCSLHQPNTGSFVDWSDLLIQGRAAACSADKSFHEGVSVSVSRSDFSLDMVYPQKMNSCGRYTFIINLHQNGIWPGEDMSISYDDTNFRYLGNASISGIKSSGSPISSFEPVRAGSSLTWSLGNSITCDSGSGSISFQVEKRCSQERPIRADLSYKDHCGNSLTDTFSGAPILLDKGRLILKKTPEVFFAASKIVTWRIYVTNSGSGTAYNVRVRDTQDPDLVYIPGSATLDGAAYEPSVSGATLNWSLPDMAPNKGYIIEFQSRVTGCSNLMNNVLVRWGCGGEVCQEVADSSKVELVSTTLQAIKHEATKVDPCGDPATFKLQFKNAGDAYAYNVTANELLPAGMVLVSHTASSSPAGFAPTSTEFSGNSLKWHFDRPEGMAPGTSVLLEFTARVADPCAFASGGTATAQVDFRQPCGRSALSASSPITVVRYNPSVTVAKTPSSTYADQNSEFTWSIKLTSNGDYAARQVALSDVLPDNAVYVSSTPAKASGSGTAADPLIWNIGEMGVSATTTITLKARATACQAQSQDRATVSWGCCGTSRQTGSTTANLVTLPAVTITQPSSLSTCGGAYKIVLANSAATANVSSIVEALPTGFVYVSGSAKITSNKAGRTFPSAEPVYDSGARTLSWSRSNVDKIIQGESITIEFTLQNCEGCCGTATTSNSIVTLSFLDSCGNARPAAVNTKSVTPTRPILAVAKTPKVQRAGGAVSWTVSISNTGTAAAGNVVVTDVLGDGYTSVAAADGAVSPNTPQAGWTTIKWTGQSAAQGSNVWQRTITASASNLDGNMSNSVQVKGSCASGCVYSQASDSAASTLVEVNKGQDVSAIVGQTIEFPINIVFYGSTPYENTRIVETLPSGLDYVLSNCKLDSCTGCTACGGSPAVTSDGSGNTHLTWTLGSFSGPRSLSITLRTRVADSAQNQAGRTLTNKVDVLYRSQGQDQTASDTALVAILKTASIGNFVWEDGDADGMQDAGEAGLAAVTVQLYHANGSLAAQMATNATGFYNFSGLFPGSYRLLFTPPAGYLKSPHDQGSSDALDSDIDASGKTVDTVLDPGENDPTWDAGFYRLASVGDYVWKDVDGNGLQNAGEEAFPSVNVTLILPDGTAVGSTITNSTGHYGFADLTPGSYRIVFTPPAGHSFTLANSGSDDGKDSDVAVDGRTALFSLSSGESDVTWDAGLNQKASLGDLVWEDLDRNGIQDPEEPGIAAVTVTLFASNGANLGSTVTDGQGRYGFSGLSPGSYYLQFSAPPGYRISPQGAGSNSSLDSNIDSSSRTGTVTLLSGQIDPTIDAGLYRPAAVGDRVWEDRNANGIQESGEPGVQDVTVRLYQPDGTLAGATTTDGSGLYGFEGLDPGSYLLEFSGLPAGFTNTAASQGGNDSTDSDAGAGGRTTVTFLISGEDDPTWDAGIYRRASLGDRVWEDANGNGIQDGGEAGLADITVELHRPDGGLLASTLTDSSGGYGFTDLVPGDYYLLFHPPQGYSNTLRDAGSDDGIDSDSGVNGRTEVFSLASGENNLTLDTGLSRKASIGDLFWEDSNYNGLQDGGEPGIAGATVILYDGSGAKLAEMVTDSSGFYGFAGLSPGDYALKFLLPSGYFFTLAGAGDATHNSDAGDDGQTAVTSLASGEADLSWDAGACRLAGIGDRVWLDANADGVQDPDEPGMSGVLVELFASSGSKIAENHTAADGRYNFTGLLPGNYYLKFTPPDGHHASPTDQGGDGSDSDADGSGLTEETALSSGEYDPTRDAGFYRLAAIGGFVWDDQNADGIYQGRGAGIPAVTVNLYHANGTFAASTSTNENGYYLFSELVPGGYYLVFLPPQGYSISPANQGGDDSLDSDLAVNGRTETTQLLSGEKDLSWWAGLSRRSSLGDLVWEDLDADGQQDAGEPGVSQVTVQLFHSNGTMLAEAATDDNGFYGFASLYPDAYYVRFVRPSGYSFTSADMGSDSSDSDAGTGGATDAVTLFSGQSNLTLDAGLIRPAEVGDRVWDDLDGNGMQDAGESGISGVAVSLFRADGSRVASTTTNSQGYYSFTSLYPGQYYLIFTEPQGYRFTAVDQGSDDGSDSDADSAGRTAAFTLQSGQADHSRDAGAFRPASVGDFVWVDGDGNGIQDQGESGLSGVTVQLYSLEGALLQNATTGANGGYLFSDLAPGGYYLVFQAPPGYTISPANQGGDDSADSDAQADGTTAAFALQSGDRDSSRDAGMGIKSALGDYVWEDLDGNGIQDFGEPGLSGVAVQLYGQGGSLLATTFTDGSGKYAFSNLDAAIYQVRFLPPTGYAFTRPGEGGGADSNAAADGWTGPIDLKYAEDNLTIDAGLYRPVSLGDYVWEDTVADGRQGAGESGIFAVKVDLYDGSGLLATAYTDASGHYSFADLPPGNYSLRFEAPSGYKFSPKDAAPDLLDSDAAADGQTAGIILHSGDSDPSWDAGLYLPAALGGFVWDDQNADGIFQGNGQGIPSVTVDLYHADGTPVNSTQTDAGGRYLFEDLIPGDYYVVVHGPPGYSASPRDQGGDDSIDSDADISGRTAIVSLLPSETDLSTWAAFNQRAALGDHVWEDVNGNGLQDGGEAGVAGISVQLYASNGTLLGSTSTDGRGYYSFTGLAPGDYYLVFNSPQGYSFTSAGAGGDADSNAAADGRTPTVTLTSGKTDLSIDAGVVRPAAVGDFVWDDQNADGINQGRGAGVPAVLVELFRRDGSQVGDTRTDATGHYLFTGLVPGDYYLVFHSPDGYRFSPRDRGADDSADSDANATGKTDIFSLASGAYDISRDAAINIKVALGDYVWNDLNADGIQDAGEPGIEGVLVQLYDAEGALAGQTTTDSSGGYNFTGLAAGDYTLKFTAPQGFLTSPQNRGGDDSADSDIDSDGKTAAVTIFSGRTDITIDAGFYRLATLGDRVWQDANRNGVQDEGETDVAGVTVALLDKNGATVRTVVTDGSGQYGFIDLEPGVYRLNFTLPEKYAFTALNQGGDGSLDSDADPASGLTGDITLVAGQSDLTWDAGIYRTVERKAELKLSKSCLTENPLPGGEAVFRITFVNGGNLSEVKLTEYYPAGSIFISASIEPDSGTDNVWTIGVLEPGEYSIDITLRMPERANLTFNMQQSVKGEGFVNVHSDLNSRPEPLTATNRAAITSAETGTISTSASVTLDELPGTAVSLRESGSGRYEAEQISRLILENRSAESKSSLSATHRPTSFSLPGNRSINYRDRWTEDIRGKNQISKASVRESYRYATDIDRNQSLTMSDNGSTLQTEVSFQGAGHIAVLKKDSEDVQPFERPAFYSQEDYAGRFTISEYADEYGENVVTNRSVQGLGSVSASKAVRSSQGSYEWGTGSYRVEEQIDSGSNYMAKDISLVHAPVNFSYTPRLNVSQSMKWQEGMYTKSLDAALRGGDLTNKSCAAGDDRTLRSYMGQQFSSLDYLNQSTVVSGLNEMKTEARFKGQARFRTILEGGEEGAGTALAANGSSSGERRTAIDMDESYSGEFSITRKTSLTGTSRYDTPHITVRKEGSITYGLVGKVNATLAEYTITVINDGSRSLGPVYVQDIFPEGTEFVESSLRPSEIGESYANWTLLSLGIGSKSTINLILNVTEEAGDLVNVAVASGGYDDKMAVGRNISYLGGEGLPCCSPQLLAEKTAEIDAADTTLIHYAIRLKNAGSNSMAVKIEDYMPPELSIISASQPPSDFSVERTVWMLTDLLPGELRSITYTARAAKNGPYTNQAHLEAYSLNGTGTASTDVSASVVVGQAGQSARTGRYGGDWQPPAEEFGLSTTDEGLGSFENF